MNYILKRPVFLMIIIFITLWFSADSFILGLSGIKNQYVNNVFLGVKIYFPVIEIIILFFIFNEILKKIKSPIESRIYFHKITKFSILFVPLFIYGSILSICNAGTKYEVIFGPNYIVYFLLSIFLSACISNMDIDRHVVKYIIEFIMLICFIKAIFGLVNYYFFQGQTFLILEKVVYGNADILFSMTLAFAFSLNLLLVENNKRKRLLYFLYTCTYVIVVFLSMRRTSIISIILVFVISFILAKSKQKQKMIIIFIVILSLVVISSLFIVSDSKFSLENLAVRITSINIFNGSITENVLSSNMGHFDDILDALDNVKDEPIFGKGFYTPVSRKKVAWQGSATFFHNAYLLTWIQMGIFGMLFYVFLLIKLINFSMKNIKRKSTNRSYFISFFCLMIVIVISGVPDGPFFYKQSQGLLVLILIALMIILEKSDGEILCNEKESYLSSLRHNNSSLIQ